MRFFLESGSRFLQTGRKLPKWLVQFDNYISCSHQKDRLRYPDTPMSPCSLSKPNFFFMFKISFVQLIHFDVFSI